MTRARSTLVSLDTTPYYHVIARCVRRWFLLAGDDKGNPVEHRKPWFIERLKLLAEVFAIDVAAYAVMSNHYHLVLHVDATRVNRWTDEEVCERWRRLFRGPLLIQRWIAGDSLSEAEIKKTKEIVAIWRERLCDLSWFMYCLNYYIALRANQEDHARGRFWEGRFFSQALVDDVALLSCMAYVDLNPVRAGIAAGLEESNFTSIQQRIRQVRASADLATKTPTLMPFNEREKEGGPVFLPFGLKAYLELVDWTGRAIRCDKRGHIKRSQPKLLAALGLSDTQWHLLAQELRKEAISQLNGLDRLAVIERRKAEKIAA